ncbi:peptidyl-prolyl cis-trans isomerase D [Monaibacterium marinum]|uniref:Parvulin-like PPIase n=1 Tax=Pontivivens marinum TaxID=1690039 RepID=A0A2C9CTB4_9RHOB|nr:peptidylprolyl isomerase [Monaibacterium marinum]SOH93619.1 peptidyl-prolyl cis-trans isomerase D [Monaibacterium marinum]
MLSTMRSKKSGFFGWILIILLIAGLGAFGFTDILTGGSASSVAKVGKTDVTVTEYRVAFENRVNAIQNQFGISIDAQTAQAQGIDQQVLGELLRSAALRDEATQLGVSTPDEVVQRQLLETPGLANAAGQFDTASYNFFLSQRGLNPARFEALMRDSETVATVSTLVGEGSALPPVAADTLLTFLGEERSIDWVLVPADPLILDLAGDDVLQTYLEENADQFRTPEQRVISYARLTPAMIAATLDYDDDALRAEYERDLFQYQTPEQRIVDRLAFSDSAAAEAARTAIDAGETSLADLAVERGLDASSISLGLIDATSLERAAREVVFATEETGIVGPVNTDLGPVLFAVNAIVPANETSFEDARATIQSNLAIIEAEDIVIDESLNVEELIAGGATIENIAEETAYEFGTTTVSQGQVGGLPPEVVAEAFASDIGADRDQVEAGTLSYYAVRVDEIIEPTLPDLADIRDAVSEAWRDDAARDAAVQRAEALQTALSDGLTLSLLAEREDLQLQSDDGITRDADVGFLPADTIAQLFEGEVGDTLVISDEAGAILISLSAITPYNLEDEAAQTLRTLFIEQTRADVEADTIGYFANAIADERGITVNQSILDQIVLSLR